MKTYQYQVLRYVHDHLTGEFVNVGIVFFEPETMFLSARVVARTQRISHFFTGVDGRALLSTLRHFENSINAKGRALVEQLSLDPIHSLEQVTTALVAPNDAAWQLSPVKRGLSMIPQATFNNLVERYINKYVEYGPPARPSDEDVWRQTYKKYFDRYRLTSKLYPRVITTAHDVIKFHQTWQNGAVHCYEAVTFDLEKPDTIKDKAYKWYGKLAELRTSSEQVHVYLLTAIPRQDGELWSFVEQKLKSASGGSLQVEVVQEDEAEALTRQTKEYMDAHA